MEKRNFFISVAIATYNGEKYIKTQLETILENLQGIDEIIVSDDGSTDKTLEIIESLNAPQIKIIKGPCKGVKKNFENAIRNCSGKYIFLSDQDDIWEKGKVERVLELLENNNYKLVVHDAVVVNQDNTDVLMPSFHKYRSSCKGIIKNVYKNAYHGGCMCFSRDILNYVLPIPDNVYMHDQWIGLMTELFGKVYFLHEIFLRYRIHENNLSSFKHDKLSKMIKNRIILIYELIRRYIKIKGKK